MSMSLTEKLAKGDDDLINVLVGSGISCATCYKNTNHNTDGFICGDKWCSFPPLNLCLKWRESRTEKELLEHIAMAEGLEKERI